MFHMALSAQVSHATSKASVPVVLEEGVGDRLCHSLPRLVVTILPLSKASQQKGWRCIVGDVCGSLENT